MLLLTNSILSYCQTQDSVKCYNRTQLQAIAKTILDGKEAQALLKVCDKTSLYQDSLISIQRSKISTLDEVVNTKDLIIEDKDKAIEEQAKAITRANRRLRWTKFGWASTSIILSALVVYVAITK